MRLNKIFIAGHLTRDPETKQFNGKSVCKFSIGVNYGEETFFLNCDAWDKLGETVQGNVTKGMLVIVEGRLKENKYTKKDGTQVISFDVICSNVQWVSKTVVRDDPF